MLKKLLALFVVITVLASACSVYAMPQGEVIPGYAVEKIYGEWNDVTKEPQGFSFNDNNKNDSIKKIGRDGSYLEVPCGADWNVSNASSPSDDGVGTYLYQMDVKFNRLPDISRGFGVFKYNSNGVDTNLTEMIKVKYNTNITCNVNNTQVDTGVKLYEGKWYTLKFIFTLENDATYQEVVLIDRDASPQVTNTLVSKTKLNVVMDKLIYGNWVISTTYNHYYNSNYNTHNDKDSWPKDTERNILYCVGNFGAYKLTKAIPSVSITRNCQGGEVVPSSDRISLSLESAFCADSDIKLYNNGVDITETSFNNGIYMPVVNVGKNAFVAKALNKTTGEIVAVSETIIVKGINIKAAQTSGTKINELYVDYETTNSVINDKSAYWYNVNATGLTNIATNSSRNGDGGFWIGNDDNSNIAYSGSGSAHVTLSGSSYTIDNTQITLKNNVQFTQVNRNNVNITENDVVTWSSYVKNTGVNNDEAFVPLAVYCSGKTVLGMSASANGYYLQIFDGSANVLPGSKNYTTEATTNLGKDVSWHKYAVKYQNAENKAWFYIDDICIGVVDKEGTGAKVEGNVNGFTQFPKPNESETTPVIYAVDDIGAYAYSVVADTSDYLDVTSTCKGVVIASDADKSIIDDITVYADIKLTSAASQNAVAYLVITDDSAKELRAVKMMNLSFDAEGKSAINNLSIGTDVFGNLSNCSIRLLIWKNDDYKPFTTPYDILK